MSRTDVIILGAGASGLAAASALAAAGRSVLVLEARGRLGGRIHTLRDRSFGMPVELGAEFIHGRPEATWQLVRQAGLAALEVPFEHYQRRNGRLSRLSSLTDETSKVMAGLARLGRRDMSFADYLRRRRCSRPSLVQACRLATMFVQGFDAADPERISAKSLAQEQEGLGDVEGEPQFRLLQGYGGLVKHLAGAIDPARVAIHLRTVVREIRWERSHVDVLCGNSRRPSVFHAPRVIITLPLGVLQLPPEVPGSVRFAPELSQKRHALNQLASGPVVKVLLKFQHSFWEDASAARRARSDEGLCDASFLHDPEAAFPTWWTPRPLRLPVLTGWSGGPKAAAMSGLSRQELIDIAIDSLHALLGQSRKRLRSLLERSHIYDWPADRFARGAYSYVTVAGGSARSALAKPIEGTLFFAGETADTSGQASTVAGALASGYRAAREVLATI